MNTPETYPTSPRRSDAIADEVEPKPPSTEWRLPSGQSLAEFALSAGLPAKGIFAPVRKPARRPVADER
jgi:hypothetical protein